MMRALVIGDEARAVAALVLEHAREHVYRLGAGMPPPGDDPRHVAHINSFRIVYSITEDHDGRRWRHMSISVPSKKFPHPVAVFMLAELFGFTGWDGSNPEKPGRGWQLDLNNAEHCIVVAQELPT